MIVLRQRASSSGPRCHRGPCPAEAAVGRGAPHLTPGAEPLVGLAGTVARFAEAAPELRPPLAGLRLAGSTGERSTEAAGVRLGAALAAGQTVGAAAVAGAWPAAAQGRPTAAVSGDATGIGMQGPGGVAAAGRLAWVGVASAPRPEPDDSLPRRPAAVERARDRAGSRDLEERGAQLRRRAAQGGLDRAEQGVARTEGGSGREDFRRVPFPRAERILDFYPAAAPLAELAKAVPGGAAEAAEVPAEGWAPQMKHEGGGAILGTLEGLDRGGRSEGVVEVPRQGTQSVRDQGDRMDSPRYQAAGWQIGPGHIEAACKAVVNGRLKRSGRRWGDDGADAVGHRRALVKSEPGQWDAFRGHSID